MKNTIFQTSAFRVDKLDEFMQQPSVILTCKAMTIAKIPWKIGSDYISFSLTDAIMQQSDFNDGDLPTQDTIVELLELIEKHIANDGDNYHGICSVTYITNEVGTTVNCYQMEIRSGETTSGSFVGVDNANVYCAIIPEPISGISPVD
tara:strand:+ start:1154 stop:1597 length:444 start_codon:yes stop_codon:yes gene_type:complete